MSTKSTKNTGPSKGSNRPGKPYSEFPLTPHATGAWQKKILGKVHYFGRWGQRVNGNLERLPGDEWWKPALEIYKSRADDLHAGRAPRATPGELTLGSLGSHFLTAKLRQLGIVKEDIKRLADLKTTQWLPFLVARVGAGSGRMSPRTCIEYKSTVDRLVHKFGKTRQVSDLRPDDFADLGAELREQYGPHRQGNEIQKVRTVFKYALDNELIKTPVRYGSEFAKPDKSEMRKHRAKSGERMLTPDELRAIIDKAEPQLKAMLLLGINCAFTNHDCALLTQGAIDLDTGWIRYPRPKTGISRRCPLWAETLEALRAVLDNRPTPKLEEAEDKVFVTGRGRPWLSRGIANPISVAARKLMKDVGVHRPRLGFATLRHIFRTVADGSMDFPSVRLIMGHADNSIDDVYREHIDDSRLAAVTDHVHDWLFGSVDQTAHSEDGYAGRHGLRVVGE